MELLLVAVTICSLTLATGLAVVAWKVLREHRRFSEARIDALVALADGEEPEMWTFEDEDVPPIVPEEVAPARPTIDGPPPGTTPPGPWRRRLAWSTAVVVLAGGTTATISRYPALLDVWSAVVRAAAASGTAGAQPIELRTLNYSIDDASDFVVSGLIANPDRGGTFDGVVAVVYLFNADGVCFATGRAAIALDRFQAGDRATFEVRVHATMPVTRYRVGFRLPDGRAVEHLDKRPPL